MSKIINFIGKKGDFLGPVLLGIFLSITFFMVNCSFEMKSLSVVNQGIMTCYTRVNQSITAKIYGDFHSRFLKNGFMSITEECFGDAILYFEDNFKKVLPESFNRLNLLASNIHKIHRMLAKVDENYNSDRKILSKSLMQKMKKIEMLKEKINARNDSYTGKIELFYGLSKIFFYLLILVIFTLSILDFIDKRQRSKTNSNLEASAMELLNKSSDVDGNSIDLLMRKILLNYELNNCLKLFFIWYEKIQKNKDILDDMDVQENTALMTKKKDMIAERKKVCLHSGEDISFKTGTSVQKKTLSINFDEMLTKTIDVLSSKIFKHGVVLDIELDETINILAYEESLEYVLYNIMNFAIGPEAGKNSNKKINIKMKVIGGVVMVDFIYNGKGPSDDFIKAHTGLSNKVAAVDLELVVCEELMKEFGGKMIFENLSDVDGQALGSKIRMLFQLGAGDVDNLKKPRLLRLKKGRRGEILNQLKREREL